MTQTPTENDAQTPTSRDTDAMGENETARTVVERVTTNRPADSDRYHPETGTVHGLRTGDRVAVTYDSVEASVGRRTLTGIVAEATDESLVVGRDEYDREPATRVDLTRCVVLTGKAEQHYRIGTDTTVVLLEGGQ